MSEVKYLLDTHILLWALSYDPRLSQRHRDILLGDDKAAVSVASLWEIAIKAGTGKLTLPAGPIETIEASDVRLLPILPEHVLHTASLPQHHRDPFDRLLIAQAKLEGLTLVTADRHFGRYDVALA